jgi:outer membrane protein assembly factor BamB
MESFSRGERNNTKMVALIGAILVVIVLILYLAGAFGGGPRRLSARKLRPVVSQQVTPFGDRLLYYDGGTIFCLSSNGTELWKYVLGSNAGFAVSDRLVVAWVGSHLHILDRNGRVTFNDRLTDNIQFAKAGTQYVAAVVGDSISPSLVIKDVNGLNVDSESVAYEDKMILDLGFFENGEYLWTTALDIMGVAPMTVMNMYRVGAMNTGELELGEEITYAVLYSGQKLHVINTRDIKRFDSRGTQDPFAKQLVYGWRLIDSVTGGGDATMLFAPEMEVGDVQQMTELRVLSGTNRDSRYTLPDTCVGAGIWGNTLFAFSGEILYRADLSAQRFSALQTTIPDRITGYIGRLSNGVALVNCGDDVWAVTLP